MLKQYADVIEPMSITSVIHVTMIHLFPSQVHMSSNTLIWCDSCMRHWYLFVTDWLLQNSLVAIVLKDFFNFQSNARMTLLRWWRSVLSHNLAAMDIASILSSYSHVVYAQLVSINLLHYKHSWTIINIATFCLAEYASKLMENMLSSPQHNNKQYQSQIWQSHTMPCS